MLRDKDIREPLFDFLEEYFGKIRIIEEKTMGKSRADVVMVTDEVLYGIEIKSDADTYARLASQVKDYDRYFDRNFVVVGTTHAHHIKEHVPDYWGVITVEEVDGEVDFYVFRQPQDNPKIILKRQMMILWRPEIATILLLNNMPKYKDLSKSDVLDKILERTKLPADHKNYIEIGKLKKQMTDVLFERDYANIGEILIQYRKSELQKKIDEENDPIKKEELKNKLEEKRRIAKQNGLKKPRKRRRRRLI